MDLISFLPIVSLAVILAIMLVSMFSKRGREKTARQKESQKALEARLRAKGLEPVTKTVKFFNLLGFVAVVVFLSWLVFSLFAQDNLGYVPAEFLALAVFFSSTVGFALGGLSGAVANKAENSGRSWLSFFWLSLLISPLVTWLVVATLKPLELDASLGSGGSHALEERIAELSGLRDKGLISQDEFEQARKNVLGL